ncbi:MAG: hypothetical protein AAGD13_03470 [Pseudomonadota bacterium]
MLKKIMQLNALSCALFGGLFIVNGAGVAGFLGDPPVWLLQVLGALLLANAAHLILEARKPVPPRRAVLYFVAGDVAWVLATIVLLAGGIYVTTLKGAVAASGVAVMVGAFALGQVIFSAPAAARP